MANQRKRIEVSGTVQGVGFRPFVYHLASSLGLFGFVRNMSYGVEIEIEGKRKNIEEFLNKLNPERPLAARIENIQTNACRLKRASEFVIRESKHATGFTQLSPDIATCRECLYEFSNPNDRRYRYPFINCTNCGPRYSIILDTPYDRKRTAMKSFDMCFRCANEFEKISDRRFHAQPDCCVDCGPEFLFFTIRGEKIAAQDPVSAATELLKKGKLIAVKGIGGFHIACDATNPHAVQRLRKLKQRPTKPFALMAKSQDLPKIVQLNKEEWMAINSPIAPIVLVGKRNRIICEEVAPGNPYLGVMVPYAPVHYLLLEKITFLVMTSANIQDEPLVISDPAVKQNLKKIVTHYLTHDRNIINRCDDSVGLILPQRGFSIIRRSRGYVPQPVRLPFSVRPTLAVGPYLKNTFTLAHKKDAYISPHVGDLDNHETLVFFNEMVRKYKKWFRIKPELIVHDLHPDYLSTKIAQKTTGKKISVQHHIAHIAACLGENLIFENTIGIAFDGTGYGLDGKIWGGEFFLGTMQSMKRVAHLEYLPLPGGEESIKKPYRIAISYLYKLLGLVAAPYRMRDEETKTIINMLAKNYNLAYTSSMGRLFDCVSAMLGITKKITYEAEAAINLEFMAARTIKDFYPYNITDGNAASETSFIIRIADTLRGIINDREKGLHESIIAAKFHNTVAQFSLDIAAKLRKLFKVNKICLSGGVFQNRYLLTLMIEMLEKNGFLVYTHQQLPTNDGCISYGQVIYANSVLRNA